MKLIRIAVIVLSAGVLLAQADKKADAGPDFKAITQKLLDAWGTMDTDKAASFYDKSANNTYFDIMPLKYRGWSAYAAGAKKVLADFQSVRFTLNPDFVAHRRGNAAWATYTFKAVLVPKTGTEMPVEGRATEIWEKRGEDWLIVHEHISAPMPEEPPKK